MYFGGKGIWLSDCKYVSLVTQCNNALCRMRKKLEENFIRDLIVLEILALCKELCLLYPQHRLTTLLLFEGSVSSLECGPNLQRTFVIITYGGN